MDKITIESLSKNLESNRIVNLPRITPFLFPKEYELLPNTSELFELEFAFYEYKFLSKDGYYGR